MKKTLFLASSCLLAVSLFAAPKGGAKGAVAPETVAEGYCAWTGLTDANYLFGRKLCSSDLRHKLTVVFFLDAAKYESQLRSIAKTHGQINPSFNIWSGAETYELPRDTIGLVVLEGKDLPEPKAIKKLLSNAEDDDFKGYSFYIYANVKGSKVPEHEGKNPFYCAFGPEPGDPLASGAFDEAAKKKIVELKKNKKYRLENWKSYYGTVEEPKAVKNYAKRLASGKPLEPLVAECYAGIAKNKDPEKAKECQILYDALEQTKSNYLFTIGGLGAMCPTRAVYEAQLVMKQFPKTKKSLKESVDKMMSLPDVPNLYKMFCQIKKWGDEDFKCKNAGEAKKIEAALLKMKKDCDGIIAKNKNNIVQGAAAWIGNEAETLAPQMAGKVPVK